MNSSFFLITILMLLLSTYVSTKSVKPIVQKTDEAFMEKLKKNTVFVKEGGQGIQWITGFHYDGELFPCLYDGETVCHYHGKFYYKDEDFDLNEAPYHGRCYNECYCAGRRKCNTEYYCFGEE